MKKILFVQTNYPGFLDTFHVRLKSEASYKQIKQAWDMELFGQGDFYSKNIRRYGFSGEELVINSWPMQSQWAKENGVVAHQGGLGFMNRLPESIKNYLGLRGWIKQILMEQIRISKADVVYMHDLTILSLSDIKQIKQMGKLVVGQIACPLPLNRRPLYHYDLLISSFPHYVEMFRSWGIKSEYLPWCFEASIAKQLKSKRKNYDVCFIGGYSSAHSQGNQILEKVARQVKVDFWGYGLSGLSANSPIRKTYHGEVWGRQMYEIMAQSRIVLNRHINVAGDVANNMRMFDATGVGSLLITDAKPNMEEFFEVDKEVVTYKSATDLTRQIKYYLAHPRKAASIAKRGQARTLKEHSYGVRMKQLAKILMKHL